MEDTKLVANRVFQLESQNLDHELATTIDKSIDELELPKLDEELKLVLKLYMNAGNLNKNATIGMQVYNLKYGEYLSGYGNLLRKPPKYKIVLLTACNLCMPYLVNRFHGIENCLSGLKLSWLTLDNLIMILKSISIINFLCFLKTGRYPTIRDRLIGLVPILSNENYHNNIYMHKIQMDFMYREIIWKVMAEFLTTVIPLINSEQIKNRIFRTLGFMPNMSSKMKLSEKLKNDASAFRCGICNKQPFNPYVIGCRHVFCYYCIKSKYLSDQDGGFSCISCKYSTNDELDVRRYKAIQAF